MSNGHTSKLPKNVVCRWRCLVNPCPSMTRNRLVAALEVLRRRPAARLIGLFALAFLGCQPSIGDKCQLSTDCSTRGDRLCDTSQPDGYCTLFNCYGESCPDDATCVQFAGTVPGCTYDDRRPSRVGRSMCLSTCTEDSDCRPGYICGAPSDPVYDARILSADKSRHVCLVAPITSGKAAAGDAGIAPVCSYSGPDVPAIDAGTKPDAAKDAAADANDAASDANGDAADAGTD
jgi:hypothetical protein